MFSKISLLLTVTLAAATLSIPVSEPSGVPCHSTSAAQGTEHSARGGVSQCNTGAVQCCDSVQTAGSKSVSVLLGLLGIVGLSPNTPVGLTCTPLIGDNGGSCTSQPVCCQQNQFNGVVNIGCTPINI